MHYEFKALPGKLAEASVRTRPLKPPRSPNHRVNRYVFFALLLLGLAFRVLMLTHYEFVNGGEVDVYLADEGIVGLMGAHILHLGELPVFFYGQHYLGALEAYLAAASFALLGVNVLALRLVTFTLSLALAALVYEFTYRAYSVAAARWATALVAVSPLYFLQWNLKARGGFIEHLVLVFAMLILLWRFHLAHDRRPVVAFALGLVSGVALWVNQLVLAYLAPMAGLLALERADRERWKPLLAGLLLGASLLIGYNVVHPAATFKTLARKAVVLNRVPVQQRDERWLARGVEKRVAALAQGADKLGLVFGVPPRAGVERLGLSAQARQGGTLTRVRQALALLPLLVFGIGLVACRPRRTPDGWEWRGPGQILAGFFLVTFVVGYVSPRYMLPAYPLAAVMLAILITRQRGAAKRLLATGVGAVLAFNVLSWADVGAGVGHGDLGRMRQLVETLEAHGLDRCYSAGPLYHIVFEAGERVIITPLQKDRYPPYDAVVSAADHICYIYRDDQHSKRQHTAFMKLLGDRKVSFERIESGPYHILYDFQPRSVLTASAINAVRRQERATVTLDGVFGTDAAP